MKPKTPGIIKNGCNGRRDLQEPETNFRKKNR